MTGRPVAEPGEDERIQFGDYRPCGECSALVPAATGCPHWKPKLKKRMTEGAASRLRQVRSAKEQRERLAKQQETVRRVAAIRQAVSDFHRQMNIRRD